MGSLVLTGDTSGTGTISVPATAGTFTATIGSATGTHYPFTSGTAVASTSGTSIDFTSIPSWVKRITVMFAGVSTSSTSPLMIQIGSGSVTTTGYESGAWTANTSNLGNTNGFALSGAGQGTGSYNGIAFLALISSNKWVESGTLGQSVNPPSLGGGSVSGGQISLGGTLDRIRITTVNGTDTFDAGSINITYE